MKKIWVAILLVLSVSPCFAYENEVKELVGSIAEQVIKSNKKSIAVADFTDLDGNITRLGRFLSEEFSTDLSIELPQKDIIVYDRNSLKSILIEHKLYSTRLTAPETIKQLGKLAGVDVLITGILTSFNDDIRFTIKIVDTETARIFGSTKGKIPKTDGIGELLAQGIVEEVQYSILENETRPTNSKPSKSIKILKNRNRCQGTLASGLCSTVAFAGIDEEGKNLSVALHLQNMTDMKISIAMVGPEPQAVDSSGTFYKYKQFSGAAVCASLDSARTSNCLTDPRFLHPSTLTSLSPGSLITLTYHFTTESSGSGKEAAISSTFAMRKELMNQEKDSKKKQNTNLSTVTISSPSVSLQKGKRK